MSTASSSRDLPSKPETLQIAKDLYIRVLQILLRSLRHAALNHHCASAASLLRFEPVKAQRHETYIRENVVKVGKKEGKNEEEGE